MRCLAMSKGRTGKIQRVGGTEEALETGRGASGNAVSAVDLPAAQVVNTPFTGAS